MGQYLNILDFIPENDKIEMHTLLRDKSGRVLLEAISSMREAVLKRAVIEADSGNGDKALKLLHQAKAFGMVLGITKYLKDQGHYV